MSLSMLIDLLKSGSVTISQNEKPAVVVKVEEKRIDVNVEDKNFVKEMISSFREGTTKQGIGKGLHRTVDTAREGRKMRPLTKEIVEDLCQGGVTITVSYKGDRAITMGSEANSKLTRLFTGTKGIQIDSALKLAEMGI